MNARTPHADGDRADRSPRNSVPAAAPTHPVRETRPARGGRAGVVLALVAALLLTTGCSLVRKDSTTPEPTKTEAPVAPMAFGSEFSRDGTFQSHLVADDIDFVFTIWAAKATPRTGEWHPKGDKYFSFSLQGYDTRRKLRDPFRTKRKIWLERIQITSTTTTGSGAVENPVSLDEWAPDVTFDPEAETKGRTGMLITSPKGGFEMRNQVIRDLADDTEGVTLTFRAIVHVQDKAGAGRYTEREVVQELPIAIFASEYATRSQPVPYNAS